MKKGIRCSLYDLLLSIACRMRGNLFLTILQW